MVVVGYYSGLTIVILNTVRNKNWQRGLLVELGQGILMVIIINF